MSARRATSETTAPGAKLSATIARFCSSLHRRRRSGPVITSNLAIAPPLAPVQALSFAPVLQPDYPPRWRKAVVSGWLRGFCEIAQHDQGRRHGGMRSRGNRIELNRGPRRGYGE